MDLYIYYGLTVLAFLITLLAQIFIRVTYKKYSEVDSIKNMKGKDVARYILDANNLQSVNIVEVKGYLSDHYDPSNRIVRLSSVSVASHECGHAIQDKENYLFLKLRAALVPLVNFSSYAGYIAIVIGIIFSSLNLIWIGIGLELIILLFQFITLPVEINASKRALKELKKHNLLTKEELNDGKKVLIAAAMTYIAGVAATLFEILRLVLIYGRKRD